MGTLHLNSVAAEATAEREDVNGLPPTAHNQKEELDAGALFVLKSKGKTF